MLNIHNYIPTIYFHAHPLVQRRHVVHFRRTGIRRYPPSEGDICPRMFSDLFLTTKKAMKSDQNCFLKSSDDENKKLVDESTPGNTNKSTE